GGAKLSKAPTLSIAVGDWSRAFKNRSDFSPFGFSADFKGKDIPIVFAGYGITDKDRNYDDYAGIDVTGKAVLILRHEPNEDKGIGRHSEFIRKAANAKAHGAVAMLVVTDPKHHPDDDSVMRFRGDTDAGIYAAHVKGSLVDGLFGLADKDLLEIQKQIDDTMKPNSFPLDAKLTATAAIKRQVLKARNVIAVLPGTDPKLKDEYVVVGAHYDHLGRGGSGSLAPNSQGQIHNGADDNASGTAGMLEIAEACAARPTKRSMIFMGFSGEELGLLGSAHFCKNPTVPLDKIAAMINLDMIGRLGKSLEVGGVDTAPNFREVVTEAAEAQGLKTLLSGSGYGPSDHASFYSTGKVPVLFLFTGLHEEYHRPNDDVELVNMPGAAKVAQLGFACAQSIANGEARPIYVAQQRRRGGQRGNGARMGIFPDRNPVEGGGVKINEVQEDGPSAAAGLLAGDVITKIDDKDIGGFEDLLSVLAGHKPGDEIEVAVVRNKKPKALKLTLGGR
ncbi:MAG: M20/M25/M40 family metallo-hydrolase, partial [Planctomycetota bacterium]